LPDNLRDRSITSNVIPTVCNVKNMLMKLISVNGDYNQFKQWEKTSYNSYLIEEIKVKIIGTPESEWKDIIRQHILCKRPSVFGPHVIDIYLVAYVAETFGPGRKTLYDFAIRAGISEKLNSA
jgi:hypothetical protein